MNEIEEPLRELVKRLADERLLVTTRDGSADEETIEVGESFFLHRRNQVEH